MARWTFSPEELNRIAVQESRFGVSFFEESVVGLAKEKTIRKPQIWGGVPLFFRQTHLDPCFGFV